MMWWRHPKSQRPLTQWWGLLMFMGITLFHILGILIFTRGFLLTRTELSEYSKCSDIQTSPCNKEDTCWTKPSVDRLVIIVFDALRFDFVAPSSFFEEKKPWMDKFHVMHRLATQQRASAQIFKAIADPPTTSLQRLKGLTTGGLPTFIDVGNSFGAPAILEDNLIHQLVHNGKRVVMMGDDTWIQLFPDHFNTSFPFPSFNVKDLDTVDNGCIEHLLPSLYRDDWDVLIAHFLGVDHAGHIFGVHSASMIDKLEQYNGILELVVEAMETQSEPGGLHENSLLLVLGDHGQTLNGDHGGGTAEEVETAMFAMSTKKPTPYLPLEVDNSYCRSNVEGKNLCISSIQQLDFSVTVAALFGIPFPFGSLGKINPELHALATSVSNLGSSDSVNAQNRSETEDWMEIYANSLCINSWQVKRYIDVYSGSSVIGFSEKDLKDISDLYEEANKIQYHASHSSLSKSELKIDAYSKFLTSVAGIARSKWTEFNLTMMITGFSIMLASIFGHIFLIKWLDKYALRFSSCGSPVVSFEMIFAYIVVLIRSCSFLSNSFILEEGKVGSFLLATTAILQLRYALMKNKMILEAILFILLIPIISFGIQLGQFKQAVNSLFLKVSDSWMLGINSESYIWINTVEVLPIFALIILACLLFKGICQRSFIGIFKLVIVGTIFNYILIAMYWASDSHLLSQHTAFGVIRGNVIPRVVYTVSLLQVLFLAIIHLFGSEKTTFWEDELVGKALSMLCSWSSTVILLSGKQGSIVALASVLGGWCIIKLMSIEGDSKNGMTVSASYASHTIQWNLLAVCLFFCTGHWCAFDGLRYASAFIGFDEFNLIRQAVLLTIETFGFSHILPIIGLPFLVAYQHRGADKGTEGHVLQLCLVYLIYGLTIVIGVTFTILCVIIQRRHLMVWGLFAPKFVFDVVALFLSDLFICLASFYYIA